MLIATHWQINQSSETPIVNRCWFVGLDFPSAQLKAPLMRHVGETDRETAQWLPIQRLSIRHKDSHVTNVTHWKMNEAPVGRAVRRSEYVVAEGGSAPCSVE